MESFENELTKRFQTLPLDKIDSKSLGLQTTQNWRKMNDERADFLEKREEYTSYWRDLNRQRRQGPWENSSDFHIPITLTYGKAIHARLWQIFADPFNFFGVKARKEVFETKEEPIRQFMQFIINDYANGLQGLRDVFDETLWDNVFDGSGINKVYWQVDEHEYSEVVPVIETQEVTIFDRDSATGRVEIESKNSEKEEIRKQVVSTPWVGRCLLEDVVMPVGQGDPQTAEYVIHRVYMTESQLKARAREKKFDPDVVEECLSHRSAYLAGDQDTEIKRQRAYQDGYDDWDGYYQDYHVVLERYGKIYVKKEITGKEYQEIDETAQEAVIWVHQATGKVLGWTYLYRISPKGIRPIFKFDFIKFPDRTHGVGVAEVLAPIQQGINAIYNLRQDNGVLASTPFGVYKASGGLKPDKLRVAPGEFFPVDDPQTDLRVIQMPFLQNFGYNEENLLKGYGEGILNISDLQIRGSSDKVGLFRTASGAAAVESASGIQLEIHYDRIARTMSKMLQCLFTLCRERIPSTFYYRITGEDGSPVFGKVNREDLRGDYDFEINVDILGEGRIAKQQKATLLMQTLMNPAFMQTDIIGPSQLYNLAKNFLNSHRVRRPDNYLKEPQGYEGEVIRPEERVFRIVVGQFTNPPIEDTVRLSDNHQKALEVYLAFENSDEFGLLTNPLQLQAFNRLKQKHQQLMVAQQAGGMPNTTGMQTPREGMQPLETGPGATQGTLGAPMGEVNGPVF